MADLAPQKCRHFFGFLTIFSLLFLGGKSQISKNLKILGNRFFSKWRKFVRNDQKQWNMVYKRILKVFVRPNPSYGTFLSRNKDFEIFYQKLWVRKSSKMAKNPKNDGNIFWAKSAIFDDIKVKKNWKTCLLVVLTPMLNIGPKKRLQKWFFNAF